jgi:hypothetical protein
MKRTTQTFVSVLAGLAAAWLGAGSALAQPTIGNVYPNGTNMFQPSAALTFSASSSAAVTNVTVALTGTSLYTGQSILKQLTQAYGLTLSGPSTALTVSANLSSNTVYSAVIQIIDANGAVTNKTVAFDTIVPTYTWEAEDYDYGGGKFFNNPQVDAYSALVSTTTDCNYTGTGSESYRPYDPGLATEDTSDQPRLEYITSGKTDYDVGWTGGGLFGNYTRNYPAGTYNIFARASGGNGSTTESANISVEAGNATMTSPAGSPWYFGNKGRGWQAFDFMPVTDSGGNLVQITFDGTVSTLNVLQVNASDNMNFFLLVPTQAVIPTTVTITNEFPNGQYQFQATNVFTFSAYSPVPINPATDVSVELCATNLNGVGTTTVLTPASGLTVTGSSTNITGTCALSSNMVYNVLIQVNDANGVPAIQNLLFDTVTAAYTFEAMDWDYGTNQFFNNPQYNAYSGLDGVINIDYSGPVPGGSSDLNRVGLHSEGCHDTPRLGWWTLEPDSGIETTNANTGAVYTDLVETTNPATGQPYVDDDVNPSGGAWADYTRNFPAGTYNIYVRAASDGITGTEADCGSFYLVTAGQGTASQSTSKIGSYSMPNTTNWQTYVWRPIMDAGGNVARFNANGSPITLRYTYDAANANQHYYMLMPAPTTPFKPFVSNFQPDGTQPFQFTNEMSFSVVSSVGMSEGNIVVNVDGAVVSGLTITGTPTDWNVTFPVTENAVHTVIVTVTDSFATTSATNSFSTFNVNEYTIQTADYDYTDPSTLVAGQFFDNPQTNAYESFGATEGIDEKDDAHSGAGYRPISGSGAAFGLNYGGLEFENPSGDYLLPQFASSGDLCYDIGFNDGGNWANYTRHYPAGTYNIWLRAASPNGSPGTVDSSSLYLVTNGWGTTNQALSKLGQFNVPNTGGWHTFGWAPLVDANGNYIVWTANGSTNTLRLRVDNGGYNSDWLALSPASSSRPELSDLSPNGATQFEQTNVLSFVASSGAGISTNSISVTLNGVAAPLVITGSSTNWLVTAPNLKPNTFYTVDISFSTILGGAYTLAYSFDTFSATNFQWEAEDWDYTSGGISGLYFDNPQVDSYMGKESAEGIDVEQTNPNTENNPNDYRPWDISLVPSTEPSGDIPRPQFVGTEVDYKIDYFGYGSWLNYTRHYPKGNFNVIGRFTEGGAATVASLSKVVSGYGTANQLVSPLGTFQIPVSSWSSFESVYLTDSNGSPVVVSFDGSQETLRFSGNPVALNDPTINAGYFMLVPASAPVAAITLTAVIEDGNIHISFPTETGSHYQLLYKNHLTDASWTPMGSAIAGSNAIQSISDTPGASSRFYRVQVQ